MEIIHIVLGKANPDRLNGVNKVVYNLAKEQAKANKNVQVWGITPNPVHDYAARNFKTVLFKQNWFPFAMPKDLKKSFLANRKAVFHLHGGWVPVFSTIARWLNRNQIKYVLTPHGAYNQVAMQRSNFKKKVYFHLMERKLLQYAHKVHLIGSSEVGGLKTLAPKAKSFLLPYGFEANTFEVETQKNATFTIGFVGRLDTYTKGLDLLISAFQIFQKQIPNSKLWIVGEGEGKAYLTNFIEKNQVKNVVFWGKKFGAEKDVLLSNMHVFAHPSRNEGLPTAVLEAAALGTPTIVTHATNIAHFVSEFEAGISIANDDVQQLAEAMQFLYNKYQEGDAQKYVVGAQKMLQEIFAWAILVNQFDELYK